MNSSAPLPFSSNSVGDRSTVRSLFRAHWIALLVSGIITVLLGITALILPSVSSLGIELVIGWLLLVGGVVRAVTLVKRQHTPGYWWSVLSAVAAIVLGVCLLVMPLQGVLTLALVLTALFAIEGVTAIFAAFAHKRSGTQSSWMLASGVINLGLAMLIWAQWPSSAAWIIGLYAGINLIFVGIPLIATAVAAHRPAVV